MLPSRNRFIVGFVGWVEIEWWMDTKGFNARKII